MADERVPDGVHQRREQQGQEDRQAHDNAMFSMH
jgi:hypothetical protein